MVGTDAAQVDVSADRGQLVTAHAQACCPALLQRLEQAIALEYPAGSGLTSLKAMAAAAFAAAANTLLEHAGIDVGADFRRADIETGGQGRCATGARLTHRARFASTQESRVIPNIGAIANITILPARDRFRHRPG